MSSVSKEQIEVAKQIDLLTYLVRHVPNELVRCGANEYTTKTHGSLVISHGKWIWNRHQIGGRSALDYLVKVRGDSFVDAVQRLCCLSSTPLYSHRVHAASDIARLDKGGFELPPRHTRTTRAEAYLKWRGIDEGIIRECIDAGILYERKKVIGGKSYYNCVFVGKDMEDNPRYAAQRGTFTDFKGEVRGSEKQYGFVYRPAESSRPRKYVIAFESPIDALSYASLCKLQLDIPQPDTGMWQNTDYLSLGGTSPLALEQYIADHPNADCIWLALDADEAGRTASGNIASYMKYTGIDTFELSPHPEKDYSDLLRATIAKGVGKQIEKQTRKKDGHER